MNCSASTSKQAAARFDRALLEQYENIDGIIPLVHKAGCAMQYGGEDHQQLNRVLSGFAKHPNIGAYLIVGLGCETGQGSFLAEKTGLVQLQIPGQEPEELPLILNIQDVGGVRKTVDRTIEVLKELLPEANKVRREPIPVSELILGCECGGSDGNSGVTANPALGIASDLLVAHGGTSILAETPEICGGEHTLTRRAATLEVGEKLIERVRWWEEYTAKFGVEINNNPSVGNKKGGLTTIYENRWVPSPREAALRQRGLSIRGTGHSKGFRIYGHARLRSGVRDRDGGRGSEYGGLHHRTRKLLRL